MEGNMLNELSIFQRSIVDDISAAVVGISKARWVSLDVTNASEEKAAEIMRKNRFDVLPITSNLEVKEFFHTRQWNNYSSICRSEITPVDIIPANMHIRDVIKNFVERARLFYFLESQKGVAGLISVANLNSRPVKLYLFSLLSEIEVKLGRIISKRVSEKDILTMTLDSVAADKEDSKYTEIKKRYKQERAAGIELEVAEYLYLSDLVRIALEKNLYLLFGYKESEFGKDFYSINDLRHAVAHPGRSLITKPDSVKQLDRRIDRMEKAFCYRTENSFVLSASIGRRKRIGMRFPARYA